jgi:hypothetical protein
MKQFNKIYQVYLENVNEANAPVGQSVYDLAFRLYSALPPGTKTTSGVAVADMLKFILEDISEIASELQQAASDVESDQNNPEVVARISELLFDLAKRLNSDV